MLTKMLTGYKDTDIIILKFLDFYDLLSFSLVCKVFNLLSRKEELWEKLCIEDLGFIKGSPIYRSFKDFYLGVKYYDEKYSEQRIFKELCKKEQNSDITKYFYEKVKLLEDYEYMKMDINMDCFRSTVKYGNDEMFEFLLTDYFCLHPHEMFIYTRNSIGKCKNENILEFFTVQNDYDRYKNYYVEGRVGNDIDFDLTKYENEGYYSFLHPNLILAFSVKLGDLNHVKKNIELCILKSHIPSIDIYNSFFYKSCRKGQLAIAQYLLEQIKSEKGESEKDIKIQLRKGLLEAARGGHIHIIEFLFSQGAKNVNGALESSARGGKINVVKYILKEKREHINNLGYALIMAINGGYKEVIALLEKEVQLKNQEVLKRREEAKAKKREKKQKSKTN